MPGKGYKQPHKTPRVKEATALYAPARRKNAGFRFRKLRAGESVPFPFIGVSSARLTGTGVEVSADPSGGTAPSIPAEPAITLMLDFIFVGLLLRRIEEFSAEQLVAVRLHLRLTQQDFADRCGLARETINAFEKGREPISTVATAMIQRRFLADAIAAFRRIAQLFRNRDLNRFEQVQTELERKWRNGITIARNIKLILGE